jgi:hypothetical protein
MQTMQTLGSFDFDEPEVEVGEEGELDLCDFVMDEDPEM